MNWKDLFKDYPKEWTKYAMMGMSETLEVLLLLSNTMDKDELVETMKKLQNRVNKDLEEIRKEENNEL